MRGKHPNSQTGTVKKNHIIQNNFNIIKVWLSVMLLDNFFLSASKIQLRPFLLKGGSFFFFKAQTKLEKTENAFKKSNNKIKKVFWEQFS